MADKKLTVTVTGDTKNVEGALSRLASSAGDAGGKIKDKLGGALAVFGGNLMTKAFDSVTNLVAGSLAAAEESAKVARETERVIRTTGGAANVSAAQVGDLAQKLSGLTGIDDEVVQGTENLLLTFTNVKNVVGEGNDVFTQASGLALDMATVLGTDASGAAIQLGKALNDPVKGITALSRAGVSFTEQQKDQIKTLVQSGDTLGAQKIILAELAKEFGGAAETAATPLAKLQVLIGNVQETIGGFFLPAIGVAADWLGARLPAATAAASAAIDDLVSSAAPVAREVFGRISEAAQTIGANLGSAFSDLAHVIADVGRVAAPIAGYFLAIAGTAVIGFFVGLSAALKNVAGFLAEHSAQVQYLATVGFVALAAKVAIVAFAYAEMAKAQFALKAMDISATIRSAAESFNAARAGGAGMIEAIRGSTMAFGGLSIAALGATAAIAGIGLILWKVQSLEAEGAAEAERFKAALETKIDTSSYSGMVQELDGLKAKMTEIGHYGAKWQERANIFKMIQMEGDYNKYKDMVADAQNKVDQANHTFDDAAKAIAAQGPAAMQGAQGYEQIRAKVVAVQEAGHIDPVAPGAVQKLQEATMAALNLSPAAATVSTSMHTMADASSTAEDKVNALKSSLDALFGISLSLWDSETKVTESVRNLADAAFKGAGMFDLSAAAAGKHTAEITKNRDMLSAVIESYKGHAQAVYESTLATQGEDAASKAAAATLEGHRQELLNVMTGLLGNRDAAQHYIDTLNLTPASINTVATLNPTDAPQKLADIQGRLFDVRQGAYVRVTADTIQAMMALRGVEAQISALDNRRVMLQIQGATKPGTMLAQGGVVEFFAGGGRHTERHVAQVVPAGSWRVFGEPETGGEAYIPLAQAKRRRSLAILAEVADQFGYALTATGDRALAGRNAGAPGMPVAGSGGGRGGGDTYVSAVVQVDGAVVHNERDLGRYLAGALQAHLDSGGRLPALAR